MSEENVEVVRRLFDAYEAGRIDDALECLAEDVAYETNQEVPARGREAVRAMWERWRSDWEEITSEPEELVDAGEHVVAVVHYTGRGAGSGAEYEERLFDVYEVRNGLITRKREFRTRPDAFAAVGQV